MRKHRCPGGVKVAEVSGSIPVHLFSIDLCCIYLVFTMLFIFVYSVVLRPRPRALLIPNLNRTSPASITP